HKKIIPHYVLFWVQLTIKALESHKIKSEKLVTHYFKLSEIEKAYEVFSKAADHHAIKVIIENDISEG
ncbi:hypothetical protein ACTEMJ_08630, partial [Streptococcus pneumoniae]